MSNIKLITISQVDRFVLYYYDKEDGTRLYNFRGGDSVCMMATDQFGAVVMNFIETAAARRFRSNQRSYKTWKDMFEAQTEVFKSVSKQVYRDCKAKLDLV